MISHFAFPLSRERKREKEAFSSRVFSVFFFFPIYNVRAIELWGEELDARRRRILLRSFDGPQIKLGRHGKRLSILCVLWRRLRRRSRKTKERGKKKDNVAFFIFRLQRLKKRCRREREALFLVFRGNAQFFFRPLKPLPWFFWQKAKNDLVALSPSSGPDIFGLCFFCALPLLFATPLTVFAGLSWFGHMHVRP